LESNTLAPHPDQGVKALPDQDFDEVWIGTAIRDPRHVAEEVIFRVPTEVDRRLLGWGEVWNKPQEVRDSAERHTHRTARKGGVPASFGWWRKLKDAYRGTGLSGGERSAQRCIPCTHDDDILRHQGLILGNRDWSVRLKPQLFTAPPLDDRSDGNRAHEMTGDDDE